MGRFPPQIVVALGFRHAPTLCAILAFKDLVQYYTVTANGNGAMLGNLVLTYGQVIYIRNIRIRGVLNTYILKRVRKVIVII